ncbi:MAG: sn-glycerol-3-phosphate ABC transporter ATP-binding protein UgpC [Elusimicrobia bacterium]|nr:sn-glycerol-3-phosphate ABC transporter ATP-binding protein UgpC [Elusimicrobiota bacterium]
MASVKFRDIEKKYGEVSVLKGINLDIKDHEFVVVVGPSGCGKSTLLRMLAGLEEITDGEMLIDSLLVNHLSPSEREIAMVFQDYALYPHMTVEENMSFALRLRKTNKTEIADRVKEAANILKLNKFLKRTPKALSGGQRQRVAIGRAIVRKPKVFLFDEPLSNLDAKLREEMRVEIAKLQQSLNATIIYVTHDQVEAMTLASRIVVMNHGNIQQIGAPIEVYRKPANIFVAGFIGSPTMNFIKGKLKNIDGRLVFENSYMNFFIPSYLLNQSDGVEDRDVVIGIRPDDISLENKNAKHYTKQIDAVLEVSELLGHRENLYFKVGDIKILASVNVFSNKSPGSKVPLYFNYTNMHIFDAKDEKRISTIKLV